MRRSCLQSGTQGCEQVLSTFADEPGPNEKDAKRRLAVDAVALAPVESTRGRDRGAGRSRQRSERPDGRRRRPTRSKRRPLRHGQVHDAAPSDWCGSRPLTTAGPSARSPCGANPRFRHRPIRGTGADRPSGPAPVLPYADQYAGRLRPRVSAPERAPSAPGPPVSRASGPSGSQGLDTTTDERGCSPGGASGRREVATSRRLPTRRAIADRSCGRWPQSDLGRVFPANLPR